ncbi:hypothetical protein AAVH_24873 [Aphelenchoides avenae]|nr:hypothetical protein AAVH_24873 [Aphelenchus avenae]
MSVAAFVASQYLLRKKSFVSGFYAIYIVQCFMDVGSVVTSFIIIRLAGYNEDVAKFLVEGVLCQLVFFLSGFFAFAQFLYHTIIAFNRYFALLHPMRQQKLWSGFYLGVAIVAVIVLAALLATSRLFATYRLVQAGDRYGLLNDRRHVLIATTCLTTGTSFVTSVVSGFVEFRTLTTFRRLGYVIRKNRKDDFRLLVYALTQFVAQAMLTTYHLTMGFCQVLNPQLGSIIQGSFPYIVDMLSLSGSICIMITR